MSNDGTTSGEKRSLPSWMDSRKGQNEPNDKKQGRYSGEVGGRESQNESSNNIDKCRKIEHHMGPELGITEFSKFLKGVVFALSGFVNPERSNLRSQALEMGAKYKPDWTSDCTLLICAFPNTPKFRQVEADCGTIVSKEWISECYNQKKLVEIDQYLLHAGKPWRKHYHHHEASQHRQDVLPRKSQVHAGEMPTAKTSPSEFLKNSESPHHVYSPSVLKEWAIYDLKMTVSWLETQEERPDPDEVKKIAVEGILTCLQDTIEALTHNQNIKLVMEKWMFVPRVVKELAELEDKNKTTLTKKDLIEVAVTCREIYETKLRTVNEDKEVMEYVKDDSEFDSDATIEMTEEEIELAYKGVGIC